MENKKSLAEGYNRSAPVYDRTAGMVYLKALWELLPRVKIGPNPAILDIGCGTGLNLLEAARVLGPCRRLVGIDLSRGMLEMARRKAFSVGLQASFIEGDAEAIDLHLKVKEPFDLVICNSVYHWFADRSGTIAKLADRLKPGGQLLVHCVAEAGFAEWNDVVTEVWSGLSIPSAAKDPWLPALPSPGELIRDLRGAGLAIEHLKYEVAPVIMKDVPEFVKTMAVVAPNWLYGGTDSAPDLVEAVTRAMISKFPGGFPCTTAGMEAVARRAADANV